MIKTILRNWSSSEERPFMSYVPMFILALLLGNASEAFAQKTMAAYNWSGNSVDNVLYNSSKQDASRKEDDLNKVVFLQHVGTGKWLKPGGDWGTELSLGDYATQLWICKEKKIVSYGAVGIGSWSKTYYFMNSSLGSDEGSWISYVTTGDKSEWAPYMDHKSGETGYYAGWNFVSLGDNKYAISSRYPNAPLTLGSNAEPDDWYLCYDEDKDAIVLKEVGNLNVSNKGIDADKRIGDPDVATLKLSPNLQWRIVTMQDIYNALDNTTSASIDEPFNLTFLIKDSGLDRCSYYNKADGNGKNGWTTTIDWDDKGTTGLKLGVEELYSSELSNSTETSRYGGPTTDYKGDEKIKEHERIAKAYGKYFCGQAKSADGRYFSQNITVPRTGWYRVSCQGFTDTPSNPSMLYATCGTDNYVRKNLTSIENFDGDGTKPTNLTEAGMMFYKKQYSNCLYIHATQGYNLALGLIFKGANSWTAFDDFELAYCGKDNPELVLDETKTDLGYITNANESYNDFKGSILSLHRNMIPNVWNTIVLPVRLTMGQCRDLFGNDTKIAELVGYNNGSMKFRRVEDGMKTDGDTYVIEANKPYIIKPTIAQGTGGITEDGEKQDKTVSYLGQPTQADETPETITETCTAPYGVTFLNHKVDKKYMDDNQKGLDGDAIVEKDGLEFRGTMIKTYDNDEGNNDFLGKYIIYGGKIYYIDYPYGLKAFRGYFSFKKTSSTISEAKVANVKFDIDGVTDKDMDVTGISEVLGDKVMAKLNPNVYTLDGKLVSTNGITEDLPKGVYVVNGKKHIVK